MNPSCGGSVYLMRLNAVVVAEGSVICLVGDAGVFHFHYDDTTVHECAEQSNRWQLKNSQRFYMSYRQSIKS